MSDNKDKIRPEYDNSSGYPVYPYGIRGGMKWGFNVPKEKDRQK